jgi:putative transposase
VGIRWYVAYPISYRQIGEMMEERGVKVDHATLNRWVLKYVPLLEQNFRTRKHPIGPSWRLDETYVRVRGDWKYLYRAVDKAGGTVDFLLTAKRNRKAALRFLRKAIGHHGAPEKITIDKSGANTAAIESHNAEHEVDIEIRQVKYLTDIFDKAFFAGPCYFYLARANRVRILNFSPGVTVSHSSSTESMPSRA